MITNAFIFARGGSKGVPKKNIKKFAGKPLIVHTIDLAKKCSQINKIYVSTDDEDIKEISIKNGAVVINRPIDLATDNAPEWLAWQHAIHTLEELNHEFDTFLSLPTTSPLRIKTDIINCLNNFDSTTDAVLSITDSSRSPWFNMAQKDENGFLRILNQSQNVYTRRQDVPQTFNLATVACVTTPNFIKNNSGLFDGKVRGVNIPLERAIDIDTELDFKIAEFLFNRRKLE